MTEKDKSLEMLEYPQVREILAGFTSFPASYDMVINLQPLTDFKQVSLLLKQSAEARHLLTLEPGISVGAVLDVRETVKMAALGKILEPQRLIEIQKTLAAIHQLRGRLATFSDQCPLLWSIASHTVELRRIEKNITDCITPTGEVHDKASPKLTTVRRQLKEAREKLLERLNAIIQSPRGKKIIQEPIITEREGRYVILVKTELKKEIKGIVHDVSNTGATAFIEPLTTMELGNTIRELVTGERREIERILGNLSNDVGLHKADISGNIRLVAELDTALAKARFAKKIKATEPVLTEFDKTGKGKGSESTGLLRLTEARHPLLGKKAIPLSVEIGHDFSILVITGPNTGGKTVALKTIGLLSLMAQAGIPIPASAKSIIPVFNGIFTDIGDEQSIEQTLSTFSWHMGNVVHIINNATEKSLVLLDELGTSTDPTEGSALARSILRYFLSKKVMTVATTHFSDLKTFAYSATGMQNASLDFDSVTLTPMYHLTVGIPGGSNALATATRLGLPPEIISDAREMISKGARELENLLSDLMVEKQKYEILRQNLEEDTQKVEIQKKQLEKELRRLKTEEHRLIEETRDGIVRKTAELHKEIRQATAELRKEEKSREKIEQAKRALKKVREQLEKQVWQPAMTPKTKEIVTDEGRITVGDTVWLKEVNMRATVLSISENSQQVEVQAGRTRFKLSLESMEKIDSQDAKQVPEFAHAGQYHINRTASLELNLRGKRADEVEWVLDNYLSDASLANLSEVCIIHGFGTGTVRSIVRDFVTAHPLVKAFRPGKQNEGGDGVTVVSL